ncbi:MAG: hypothetical protein HQ594_05140 [Candidatus Omnitrophica bacterium]|nr:hypothetical protein [Candidatus Omnitrophota bacterium]
MTKFQRRVRLFIAKSIQIRYVGLILIGMFLTAVITGYTVYTTILLMLGERLAVVYPQGLLMDIIREANMVLVIRLIPLGLLVVLIGLVLSNRIAGPIYRIQKFIIKISRGKYNVKLKLRKKDELKDVASSLNSLASRLDRQRGRALEEVETALDAAGELGEDLKEGRSDKDKILKQARHLRKSLDKLKEGL